MSRACLRLEIEDREVGAALQQIEDPQQRERFALTALKIGGNDPNRKPTNPGPHSGDSPGSGT